jgi:hypothetical protein
MNLYEESYKIDHFALIAMTLYEISYRLTKQAAGLKKAGAGLISLLS